MKFAFIDEDMSPRTGSRRFTCEVAGQLSSMGHEVRIFTLRMDRRTCFRKCLSLPVDVAFGDGGSFQGGCLDDLKRAVRSCANRGMLRVVKDLRYDLNTTSSALGVSRKIARGGFDAVLFHYHGGHWLFPFFYHLKGVRSAVYLNMVPPRPRPNALPFQESSMARRVTDGLLSTPLVHRFESESMRKVGLFMAPSEFQLRQAVVQGVVGQKEAAVVPLGVDHSEFHPAGEEEPFMLYVGRVHPHKSVELAIKAMKGLRSDFSLVIAGEVDETTEGYMKGLSGLAGRLGVSDRVRMMLHPSEEQILDLMQRCSAFLFPSTIDTFGLVVLEAMACGKPVVACRRGGVPEIVGDAGFLLEPTVTEWHETIDRLQSDSSLRQRMGKKALERSKIFSWEKTAGRLLQALQMPGQARS